MSNDYHDDLAGMTEKQRLMYWRGMGAVELPFLRTKGTLTGEQPDPRYTLNQYVDDRERAYKRHIAMLEEYAAEDAAIEVAKPQRRRKGAAATEAAESTRNGGRR